MGKLLPIVVAAVALACASAGQAAPINGTFDVTVWQGIGNGVSTDPNNQALASNPLANPTALIATFTYTGGLNFLQDGNSNQDGSLATFIGSGGGSLNGCVGTAAGCSSSSSLGTAIVSSTNYGTTTLFEFTPTAPVNAGSGIVIHDDGIGLYQPTGTLITALGDSAPTSAEDTNYILAAGSFDLFYVEANGLPAQLDFEYTDSTTVPEPSTGLLFGTALLAFAFGLIRRKGWWLKLGAGQAPQTSSPLVRKRRRAF
jgi:hypothetical protein